MAPTLPSFNPGRLRTYVFRLPLFTRIILLSIVLFWILELQSAWNVTQWGALVPKEVNLGTSMFPRPELTSLMSERALQGTWFLLYISLT